VLADEPTEALETQTLQKVMDLMTHESAVATQTHRTSHIKDGLVSATTALANSLV
jgi:ABC-type lipoprotein export system ATPase subunit